MNFSIGMFGVGIGMLYTPVLVDRMQLAYPSGYAVANILRALTEAGINVTYAYFSGEPHGGTTTTVLKVADLEKAVQVLQAAKGAK